ncbi:MAG: hypothetical protein KatS3mg054_0029 [Chloroflexus sp.]|nr:MAG: hypothetical protein KatS3mg054_0029 [Chloroflexus sp.]
MTTVATHIAMDYLSELLRDEQKLQQIARLLDNDSRKVKAAILAILITTGGRLSNCQLAAVLGHRCSMPCKRCDTIAMAEQLHITWDGQINVKR